MPHQQYVMQPTVSTLPSTSRRCPGPPRIDNLWVDSSFSCRRVVLPELLKVFRRDWCKRRLWHLGAGNRLHERVYFFIYSNWKDQKN